MSQARSASFPPYGSSDPPVGAGWGRAGLRRVVRTLGPFVPLLLLWQISAASGRWSADLFPPPSAALAAFWDLIRKGILPTYLYNSLVRLLTGVAFSVVLGVVLGVALGINRRLGEALEPTTAFFQSIAEIAWIPLALIWFGFGFQTMIFLVIYTAFFPIFFNTLIGVRSIPPSITEAMLTLGARRHHLIREVVLPGALPGIITGVRLGAGYGWRALIAGEMIVGVDGLGFLLFSSRSFNQTDRILVCLVLLGALWLVTDRLILKPCEEATIERWGLVTTQGP